MLNTIILVASSLMALGLLLMIGESFLHRKDILELKDQPIELPTPAPKVSIIFSAQNEEEKIGEALTRLCRLTYPNYEIVAVNDRSTDQTEKKIDRVLNKTPHLKVNVDHCPADWIGKNHALWQGYKRSNGDFLVFTDADVLFEPDSLSRAVTYALKHQLDHLVLYPGVIEKRILPNTFLLCFFFVMTYFARPWRLKNPRYPDAIGIGAFNMVRRSSYLEIGTHESFRLSVIDDIELGRRIKKHHLKQDGLVAQDHVRVEWQSSLKGYIKGLEKNAFAGTGFSLFLGTMSILLSGIALVVPFANLFLATSWIERLPFIIILICIGVFYQLSQRFAKTPFLTFFLLPLGIIFLMLAMLNSIVKTLRQGGIKWRESFYPLEIFPKPTWREIGNLIRRRY